MKASELHAHLSGYLAQSPQNAQADVVLRQAGSDFVFGLAGANDAHGVILGQHLLIFVPDETAPPIGVREFKAQ